MTVSCSRLNNVAGVRAVSGVSGSLSNINARTQIMKDSLNGQAILHQSCKKNGAKPNQYDPLTSDMLPSIPLMNGLQSIAAPVDSEYPTPRSIEEKVPFYWNDDIPPVETYVEFGKRLAVSGDFYRAPEYGGGLIRTPSNTHGTAKKITKGSELAPEIADRVRVAVIKKGKSAGGMPSSTHLNTMLGSEAFLQQFLPLDLITTAPVYLPGFNLTEPGYNDGGIGHRVFQIGPAAEIPPTLEVIKPFLKVMAFASESDRTNAVAAALTVMLRNFWPGAKPMVVVTSTKSHGGKDTVIEFATGQTEHASISYEVADWALQKNFAALVKQNPDIGVVTIENVRLKGDQEFSSAFLERFVTDAQPVLHSTGTGDAVRQPNNWVLAASTNFGQMSEDIMNRALPIHLNPVGDVAHRKSPIGNPRLEYLPAHRAKIAAELRGMIEQWKTAGQPLDESVKHPFSEWARTIGGILKVAGYEGFLGNSGDRKTKDDPLRSALGLLGVARENEWLRPQEWALVAAELGLVKRIIQTADRDTSAGRERGLGRVLTAHREETFEVETDDEIVSLRLEKARRRFVGSQVTTRYRFRTLAKQMIPEDEV